MSQFNRSVRSDCVRRVLQALHDRNVGPPTALSYLDGKPLVVGVASKDPDARRGHVMGGFARGYKLHAWMSRDRRVLSWAVLPLNVAEQAVAGRLAEAMPRLCDRSLVLVGVADRNYDSHVLHKQIEAAKGRLVAWPKAGGKANSPAGAEPRHPVTMRQMGRARRALVAACGLTGSMVQMALSERVHAEGILGNLTSRAGGLGPLPAWVRRLKRVRRWVGCKVILYNTHVHAKAGRFANA